MTEERRDDANNTPEEKGLRPFLWDAVQETNTEGDAIDGAVLTGYLLIAEWMDEDGMKWLSVFDARNPDTGLTSWERAGWLYDTLHNPQDYHRREDDDIPEEDGDAGE